MSATKSPPQQDSAVASAPAPASECHRPPTHDTDHRPSALDSPILLSPRVKDVPGAPFSARQLPCEDCGEPSWVAIRDALDPDRRAVVVCTVCVEERCDALRVAAARLNPDFTAQPLSTQEVSTA